LQPRIKPRSPWWRETGSFAGSTFERTGLTTKSTTTEKKAEVIAAYRRDDGDTGSPEVQVAILTTRIQTLTDHFKSHAKDNHSRRGLLMMVNKRRSLLAYLKKEDAQRYIDLIGRLGLRK